MRFVSFLLLLAMVPRVSLADCPNAVSLHVGDTVKDCDRIGLSLPYDGEVRKQLVENDYNKQIVDQQKKVIEMKDLAISSSDKQAELWKGESSRLREDLDSERNRSNWTLWGGILAGVALTALAGWSLGQVKR